MPLPLARRRAAFLILLALVVGCDTAGDASFVDEPEDFGSSARALGPGPASLVKSFAPAGVAESSNPTDFVRVGQQFFFLATTPEHGRELWKSDGTTAGTVLVKDLVPGSGSSTLSNLTDVNGTLFFTLVRGTRPPELWKSDGTEAGTLFVSGVYGVEGTSALSELTNVNGMLYLVAVDEVGTRRLWRSDGTTAGTTEVPVYGLTGLTSPAHLTNVNGTLFFSATTRTASGSGASRGNELWKVSGSSADAALVKDIYTGTGSSSPEMLTDVSGTLYFWATDSTGQRGLWRSNGYEQGTVLVQYRPSGWLLGGSSSEPMSNVNGSLFFRGSTSTSGYELMKSDLTAAGLTLVKDIRPGLESSSPGQRTKVGSQLLFYANDGVTGDELWRSNGTPGGTVLVKDIQPGSASSSPRSLTNVGSTLYFNVLETYGIYRLWKSDGYPTGTVQVSDLTITSTPRTLMSLGGTIFFAADDGVRGVELWKSDGTTAGTVLVKNIAAEGISPPPVPLADHEGNLYFTVPSTTIGGELWKSDGTPDGTTLVRDIRDGPQASIPKSLTVAGGTLYFTAYDNANGRELWKTDGTQAGTTLIADIYPGAYSAEPSNLTDLDGTLLFTASSTASGSQDLWKSDGTEAGTVLVKDLNPGSSNSPSPAELTVMNGKLYFTSQNNFRNLWTSDGTKEGTAILQDLQTNSHTPASLTVSGGSLFFTALSNANGRHLRKVDGATGENLFVKQIGSGTTATPPSLLTDVDGTLYFRANATQLWKSDGTTEGTVLVRDVRNGALPTGGALSELRSVNGQLYFIANDGTTGIELWKSDGTSEGTMVVKDITPGADGFVSSLAQVGNALAFAAYKPGIGLELWRTNGHAFTTRLVHDVLPGAASSGPTSIVHVDSKVFFVAQDEVEGQALFVVDESEIDLTVGMACPDVFAEATGPGGADVVFSPYALDEPLAAVTTTPASGSRFALGDTLVTATVEGGAGSCSFVVTVRDTTKPEITCPASVVVEATGPSGATATYPEATATDAVSTPTVSHDHASGSTFPLGETTVTATATDAAGHVATCAFTVTVQDTTAPTLSCPEDVLAEATGPSGAQVTYPAADATDAVSTPVVTYSDSSGSTFALGETTVTATATDDAGNATSCTFTVTVTDTTAPALICPEDVVVEATSAEGSVVSYPEASATDAVSTPSVTYDVASEGPFALGATTVTATATDAAANVTTCSFTVTVRDTTAPAITCPTALVIEATGASGAVVTYPDTTATDSVSTPIVEYDLASGSTFALGTTTVEATATDAAGNHASCSFTVEVRDTTRPTLACPADVVAEAVDASGASVSYPEATTTDAVSTPSVTYDLGSGGTFALGTTTVTATAIDAADNVATCTFTVIVRDTTSPSITCPEGLLVEATDAAGAVVTYVEATAADDVSTPTVTYDQASGTTFAQGQTLVTATATDEADNVASCSFTIMVVDTTAPSITCPADVSSPVVDLSGARVTYPPAVASDAVSTPVVTYDQESGSTFPVGETTVTATATDEAGNVTSCAFTVSILDTTPPEVVCPEDVVVEAVGVFGATVTYPPAVATDNGSIPAVTYSHPSESTFPRGALRVTATATDSAGNVASCSFIVSVVDTTLPEIACPQNIVTEALSAEGALVVYPPASATDNVSPPYVTYDKASRTVFPPGETVVTATATDVEGNVASCSFTVTVADTTKPTITCPEDVSVEIAEGAGTFVAYEEATATDTVSTPSVTYDHPADQEFAPGKTTVTAIATDGAGNRAECTFDVMVTLNGRENSEGGCGCAGSSAPGAAFLLALATLLGKRRRSSR